MPLCTRAGLVMFLLFSACTTAALKIGTRTADYLVLCHVYGPDVVAAQHLQIIGGKPNLRISNGDVLSGYNFVHFLISAAGFVVVGVLCLAGATLAVALADAGHSTLKGEGKQGEPGLIPLLLFIPLAVSQMLIRSLWPNVVVLAAALLLAWSPRLFAGRTERI